MSRLVILWNVPHFGFVYCFYMIRLRLCIFGVTTPEVMLCPSQCLVAGDKVNFDHMAEMVCVRFLHYQIINFAFEITKNLMGRYLEVV